jgi:hypothetical protein
MFKMRRPKKGGITLQGPNFAFAAIGTIVILFGIIVGQSSNVMPDLLLSIGLSILTVSLINILWGWMGNEPVKNSIDEIQKSVQESIEEIRNPIQKSITEIQDSIELLQDSHKTGVIRVMSDREDFIKKRLESFRTRMRTATEIDVMGRVLYSNWANSDDIKEIFRDTAERRKCTIRILVLDPDGTVAQDRDAQEKRKGASIANIRDTLRIFTELKESLSENALGTIELKTIDAILYEQIARVDGYIWVQPYLHYVHGSGCPSFEIEGTTTSLYKKYKAEFEALWPK